MTMRDDDLRRFLDGDDKVVGRVHAAVAMVVARFRSRGPDRSPELVQETMGRVFVGLAEGRYRADGSIEAYAGRTARNVCLEHLRRERRLKRVDGDTLSSDVGWGRPDERMLREEQFRERVSALTGLSEGCLDLFRMIFVERLSYEETAERLGISQGALRVRIHRCRARCMKALGTKRTREKIEATRP